MMDTEIDLNRLVREIIPKCDVNEFLSGVSNFGTCALATHADVRSLCIPGVSSNIMFVSARNPKLSEHKVISSDWNPLPL